ncbi:MAG: CBS domain-containing protein [Candidatus Abyssobacteria bacterium SURF_5]|uniref:CBS domain-containing protein n=1 Tax=Abyssobacteria bacterium (strain SURF_5) TaxID=2093360 RepID=A0A3A4NXS1_ABYX5|nr:MAG: CBS domain-containing protein [Candidatus Abyssubacteria bacterium SURF_5]
MPSVPAGEVRLIVHVGLMLILGLFFGGLVARVRVPRVTGYLAAGFLLGPSVSRMVQWDELRNFDLIAQLALGLIMFSIGGEFRADHIRRFGRKLFLVTAVQMVLTWALVGGLLWLVSRNFILAVVVGFIAMETAPATTLVVIKEYESEGSFTSNLMALVGINNFLCLILFPFLLVLVMQNERGLAFSAMEAGRSMLLGLAGGFALSFLEERVYTPKQQLLLAIAAITLVVGMAYAWGGSGPLATLVLGAAKRNTSAHGASMFQLIDASAYPFYVIFFVIAGANLHLETLVHVGLLGAAYIGGRTLAKIAGSALGASAAGLSEEWRRYLGLAMLSHAGVAIGLAMAVGQSGLQGAQAMQAIVLGSIVVFEVFGPLSVRFSLVRCGEVKLVSLLPHLPGRSVSDILEMMASRVRASIGLPPSAFRGRGMAGPAAKHVMRRNVESVLENAGLDELMKIFSHARYDLLPVVTKEGRYIGNISFARIRDVIFDEAVADLLIARDMLDDAVVYVTPGESVDSILQKFSEMSEEVGTLPVISEGESPRVVGMVRQRDAVDAYWRAQRAKAG